MHPQVQRRFHRIIRRTGVRPERVLEVGGVMGPDSLLHCPELAGAERYCLNLVEMPSADGIVSVTGNANRMDAFDDESFDLVMTNATLEHDRRFWLSVAEMKRVLRPQGLLIVGVPGYMTDAERDHGLATHTYRVHYEFDYYRFSEQAVREVFFEGMRRVRVASVLAPPRLVGHGFKPRPKAPPPSLVTRARRRLARAVRGE